MQEQITPEMKIGDILNNYPQKSQRLTHAMSQAGLQCASCHAAVWETLEEGMKGHGKSPKEVETLVAQLNEILAEKIDPSTISMTEKAAQKFREFAKEEGSENLALRFGDTEGGCSGYEYVLDFEEAPKETDEIFESFGVKILVQKGEMVTRLMGSVIDYVDGLQGAGFKVSNPNVKRSCRCGHSQTY